MPVAARCTKTGCEGVNGGGENSGGSDGRYEETGEIRALGEKLAVADAEDSGRTTENNDEKNGDDLARTMSSLA